MFSSKKAAATVAILAGGRATRLRPLSDQIPKSLVPILQIPFVFWQLHALREWGVTNVVFLSGYRSSQLRAAVGDGSAFALHVDYAEESETEPLGTGGAVVAALSKLSDPFITLYGDSYLPVDFPAAAKKLNPRAADALMLVRRVGAPQEVANVEFGDGIVRKYQKGNPSAAMQHIDYGASVWTHAAFQPFLQTQTPFDLGAVQSHLAEAGRLAGLEVTPAYYEVGSFEGVAALEAALREAQVPTPKAIAAMRRKE